MRQHYRVMLGKQSAHAAACFAGKFIGADYGIDQNFSGQLPDDWRAFNAKYIPHYLAKNPGKSKVGAGLACGALWTLSKGIKVGDIVLCPDGTGRYRVGEVTGEYQYAPGEILPHRRPVAWREVPIDRAEMSQGLKRSTGATLTVVNVSIHSEEIEKLIGSDTTPKLIATDQSIEDPVEFALEKHLEEFLVANWKQTSLGKEFDIYEEDGELVGQQYPSDTGPIDILAVSKDRNTLLVIELKKGRASDVVVGQTLRYMGFVHLELAEPNQAVRGIIVALEDDPKLRRALAMTPSIEFYRYSVSFKLTKA